MPKKTKRQKIATEMRKHRIIEEHVEVKQTANPHAQPAIVTRPTKKNVLTNASPEYFKKDLKKSLIISAVLLLLEVGIYVGQQSGMSLNISFPF